MIFPLIKYLIIVRIIIQWLIIIITLDMFTQLKFVESFKNSNAHDHRIKNLYFFWCRLHYIIIYPLVNYFILLEWLIVLRVKLILDYLLFSSLNYNPISPKQLFITIETSNRITLELHYFHCYIISGNNGCRRDEKNILHTMIYVITWWHLN